MMTNLPESGATDQWLGANYQDSKGKVKPSNEGSNIVRSSPVIYNVPSPKVLQERLEKRGGEILPYHIDQLPYLLGLSNAEGIGPVTSRNLIAYCGSPEAVFSTPKGKLMRIPGIGPHVIEILKSVGSSAAVEKELEFCDREGIEIIPYYSKLYPKLLKGTFGAPLLLFKKGNIDLNAQPTVGIVGTRKATDEGRALAVEYARYFSSKGFNVVSGLALGIDISAHKGALECSGVTTGVLGHGLDRIYPARHHDKAQQMLENGGLITEFFSGTTPIAQNFPARNRILSGLCRAVIVIEATKTGGALITAKMAFEQNREVFAVPGNLGKPTSEGCNNLIRRNIAKLITCPSEVLEDLDFTIEEKTLTPQIKRRSGMKVLSKEERKVITIIEAKKLDFDGIVRSTGIKAGKLNPLLLAMEFKGLIGQGAGKMFFCK